MSKTPVRKFLGLYYQVFKVDTGFGWKIFNCYGKDKEVMEEYYDVCDSIDEAEQNARESISYHYI